MSPVRVTAFVEAFCRWARAQADVEAAVLVGSYARGAETDGSDVDLVILTSKADKYVRDRSWVSVFGEVAECRVEDYGRLTSVRAFYDGGLEVEYCFATPDWAGSPIDAGTSGVINGGMKVLYDPRGIAGRMRRDAGRGSADGPA